MRPREVDPRQRGLQRRRLLEQRAPVLVQPGAGGALQPVNLAPPVPRLLPCLRILVLRKAADLSAGQGLTPLIFYIFIVYVRGKKRVMASLVHTSAR